MPDKPSLFELIERELDPELRAVLEHYRAACVELEIAAQKLGRTGRNKWQMAAVSRSRDIEWQAQRYMDVERARQHKLEDYRDDAPTNPRGYPPITPLRPAPVAPVAPIPPLPRPLAAPRPRRPASFIVPPPPRLPSVIVEPDEVTNHYEAVFDTDRPPSRRWYLSPERRQQLVRMSIELGVVMLIVWTLWYLKLNSNPLR